MPLAVVRTAAAPPLTPGRFTRADVDLAEFDAAAADLHLVVGAALEVEAVGLQPDQVAAAVGARPPQRRHRRVLLGVLLGIEVAGQPDAADHQFADLAERDRVAVLVDDGQVPAGQRQPDADRARRRPAAPAHATTVASVGP